MFKYYIFAFLKANLIVFLIFGCLYLLGLWNVYSEYHILIFLISNFWFQIAKPSYKTVERRDEVWSFIRFTEGKKWYHRYLDYEIRDRLKDIK